MEREVIRKQLEGLGLKEKEATLYLSTLELGEASASDISRNSQINRVTAYGILELMVQEGYILHTNTEGVQKYMAVSPEVISEKTQARLLRFQENLPFLMTLQGDRTKKPQVRYFEGLKGIKKAYKESLMSQTEILNYANSKLLYELWPTYHRDYVQKRIDKEIFLRGLYPENKKASLVQERDEGRHRETRILPEEFLSAAYEMKIFDNKILLAAYEDQPFAVLIESAVLYKTQKQIFEFVWQAAKK